MTCWAWMVVVPLAVVAIGVSGSWQARRCR